MRHVTPALVLILVAALLACKSGSSSSSSPAGSSSASPTESADDEPIGKLGSVTTAELESRARKAGYTVKSADEDKDSGMLVHILELENDDNYAYVTFVDLGQDETNRHAIQLGDNAALVVHFDDAPSQLTAKKLRDEILAAQPLDGLDRNTLKQALKKLGWDVSSTSSDTEDGITTTNVYADKGANDVTLVAFDFRAAKREDRMAIDASRFMNVFVCQDCTKRKEGLLADMTHRRRARKLLAKLTKP